MRNRIAPYLPQNHGPALCEPIDDVEVPEQSGQDNRSVERLLHKTQSVVVNHPGGRNRRGFCLWSVPAVAGATTMKINTESPNSTSDREEPLFARVSRVRHDLLRMLLLQIRLLKVEWLAARRKALIPLCATVACLVLLLSCVPLALIGLAQWLMHGLAWSPVAAYLTTAGVAAALALLGLWLAIRKLRAACSGLRSWGEELSRNAEWVRTLLQHRSDLND